MAKRKKQQTYPAPAPATQKQMTFSVEFGDAERVPCLGAYDGVTDEGDGYWTPPIDREALAKLPDLATYHGACLGARAKMVAAGFLRGGGLTPETALALAVNFVTFGDVALLKIRNGFGQVVRLYPLPSVYVRRSTDGKTKLLLRDGEYKEYTAKDVIFIRQYDTLQQIYGKPDYLGGIQSAMLNSDATMFRRKYYRNGAHMGYILYATDPDLSPEMEKEISEKIEQSKGAGNFRSMFINIPNGKPDGVKIIPVGDVGTKDEYVNIKRITAQDQLTAHRFPPGLAGIIPDNVGGLGDPLKVRAVYQLDEVWPMQTLIENAINSDSEITRAMQVLFKKPQAIEDEK
ncbi:phage portal protein [Salmonella enterica subsp. enterica]|nr:phage portal protein [Salmonella enterica subsp. enterica serovar Agbeni]EGL2187698.1 phage portal protein [Salmonella enterica subsp. enterica serovar Agbeni]EID1871329.1 phage portal protein [Salmonella enterica subsp. enterica]